MTASRRSRSTRARLSRRPVVAVTGAGGPAGSAVVAALVRAGALGFGPSAVIAVEDVPSPEGDGPPEATPDAVDSLAAPSVVPGPIAPGPIAPGPIAPGPIAPDVATPGLSTPGLSTPGLSAGADPAAVGGTPADGVLRRRGDISSPRILQCLAGADVVVHMAAVDDLAAALEHPWTVRRARAVRAVQAVTTAAAAVGAGRLIVVTSAMVFGARPDNPIPLPDDCELRADPDDGLVGDLLEIERVLARTPRAHPGLALTVIRPAALAGSGVDTSVTRHFEAPRLVLIRGADTRWQFCHLDDLGSAVVTALEAGLDGELTVASDGALSEVEVETQSRMRRLDVPQGLAFATVERLHRVGVLPTPAGELAYVVHPWVVGSQRLAEAGWRPAHQNAGCLAEVLEQAGGRHSMAGRRVDRRDAAVGAAGAAVALVGTAAILRQARSRQGRRRRPTLDR